MKLKTYNAENASRKRSGKPAISFSPKGPITLNKAAVFALNLKEGDTISISQDEESVKDWFLHKDPKGLKLRSNTSEGLVTNSALICEDIRACLKEVNEKKSSTMFLITEPVVASKVQYFPILTSSAH